MTISHLYKCETPPFNWVIQSNEEHCSGVASLARGFAAQFGFGKWGLLLGLLHDRGKEKEDFQNYIKHQSGFCSIKHFWKDKSHSLIGAILLANKFHDPFRIMPNIIAGHHRGLYDTDELIPLLKKDIPVEINCSIPEIALDKPSFKLNPQDVHHITRMLFSCLVDADYLDTESFMQREKHLKRTHHGDISSFKKLLDNYLSDLQRRSGGYLNVLRKKIQDTCLASADGNPGFYTLTVPTGGGKTLASVLWAINHAKHNSMKRIIIAIPYTSIIVQTAEVLRSIFGKDNVLEHHSVVDEDNLTEGNKLAAENWDAPIIVTTNVQLFESIFSNRSGKCRKIHSLCNSVVILDEMQSLPLTFLQPICDAMQSYSKLFGTSFLFCTASQPIIDGTRKGLGKVLFNGIDSSTMNHLIPAEYELHKKLRRVNILFDNVDHTEKDMAAMLSSQPKALCIVNSRKLAKSIFNYLEDDDSENIHLSRMMCAEHIKAHLEHIKDTLTNSPEKKIRVVSTQLVEAGVDMDFPIVYRQFSGLDSILQAAGRCNREGLLDSGHTYVFRITGHKDHGSIRFASDAMKSLLNIKPDADWLSPTTMNDYYKILYSKTPSFDKNDMTNLYSNPTNVKYEEISAKFRLISDSGVSVIVNYGNSPALIDKLKIFGPSRNLVRELGKYAVTVHRKTFEEFLKMGIIEVASEGIYHIPNKEQYDLKTGLKTTNEYLEQPYII